MDVNKALLQKYYDGHCNALEKRIVEEWLMELDPFNSTPLSNNSDVKNRMWNVINAKTIAGSTNRRRYRLYAAIAACGILLFTTGIVLWERFNSVPDESAYVIIDNTHRHLQAKQHVGDLLLSESANSGWKSFAAADNKNCLLYANSLIINNQKGKDIWVYLKMSSEKGSGMIKFLCKRKSVYVAGYITEHTATGKRKYLYSKQSGSGASLPEEITSGINSQLNAAKINGNYNGYTTIII